MLSALFTSVADALISYAIDKLDPAEQIKSWLRLDPARLAFKKVLARAYSAFARQYPEYTSSLFDQSFLSTDALPELSKLLTRNQHPDPALLAQAWGRSIGAAADFTLAATKPAAYFLERFEAELKAESALHSLFDSRALESLPKLEAEIQKLSAELQHGLDEVLKSANNYQQANIHVGGSVSGDGIVIGNNNNLTVNKFDFSTNYYYSGDFISLSEYYIPPDGVFQRVDVDNFVGRDWLTAKVDAFLNDPQRKSGAFLLIGDAGVGKTSFMAHLVKERRYLHLFAEQAPGQAMLQRAMQSLGSQLVTRYQIDPYKDRDTLNALSVFPDFLERILRLAASTLTNGEKIVIVCDALDEAGVFPDHFVFGLPKELPDGVYFILSQRPVNVKLPNFEPVIEKLEAQGKNNLQDIQAYLSAVAMRPEVAEQIRSKEYSEDFFIQTLKEKSQGVWMYLHYIIKEIESGARAPLDLANLPTGLVGYYAEYWDAWRIGKRGKGEEAWDELYAPLLTTLAAAQEAITVIQLTQWADVTVTPREVTRLLTEHWRAFITEKEKDGKKAYVPYHLSFKDFITGRVDTDKLPPAQSNLVKDLATQTVDAHKRIACAFEKECSGEWEKLVEQDYPRLHLTAHLNGAREYETLRILLTEGDEKIKWAEAREKKEETYAGYVNDLTYVWDYVEREQNYALAIRCMLIENSIHSLASNISSQLLAELAKAGLWSYARCLNTIRLKSDTANQVDAIKLFAPNIPSALHQESLTIAYEIKDEEDRTNALIALIPYLNDELKAQTFSATCRIKNEDDRKRAFITLASHSSNELKAQILSAAREITTKYIRVRVLAALVLHLKGELKIQTLQEALFTAREIKTEYYRVRALAVLAPQLNGELKTQVLQEALFTAREIESEEDQAYALNALVPYLDNELKTQVLQETLAAARKIRDKFFSRERALIALAPHLNNELKVQAQAISAVQEISDKNSRANALTALIPHLNDELKARILQEALSVAREIKEENPRSHALNALVPYLDDELKTQVLQEALAAARKIRYKSLLMSDSLITRALIALAPNLTDELKIQALAIAHEIKDEDNRSRALAALVPQINDELKIKSLPGTISAARKINDEDERAYALVSLAPHFDDELKTQVLSATREIKDEYSRANTLAKLMPYLNNELKIQALLVAREIKDEDNRVEALSALVPFLNDELKTYALQEAFSAAREINDKDERAYTLAKLALHLNDELKTQALSAVCEIKEESYRIRALAVLAPYLNDELKTQALSAAREIEKKFYRVRALAALAPYLNNELKTQVLQEALSVANEMNDEDEPARVLVELAPLLNDELKMQVLAAVREIEGEFTRAQALADFVPYLNDEIQISVLYELLYLPDNEPLLTALNTWKKIEFKGLKEKIIPFIKFTSQNNRDVGVETLAAFTPALVHFHGPEIVPELYRAIQDTARWWQ